MPELTPPAGSAAQPPHLPPPPPADDPLALIRWSLTALRASTGADRAAIRRRHTTRSRTESMTTISVAVGTDLVMFGAKAVAAMLTGSVALFAEALHSLADTANQVLLFTGLRRARRSPDLRHPFGYGAEMFYWSLIAALGTFAAGGVLSIWEGTQRLLHPTHVQASMLGFVVLGLGCVLDGFSWLTSVRQLHREARARGISFRQHIRSTTDTAVTAVYYEDAAALLGAAIALAGLGAHELLHSPAPDAAAGILVGLLLATIGLRLAGRNRALLTNRSDSVIVLDRIRDRLSGNPDVAAVGQVASVYVGPHQLLVTAEIEPSEALSSRGLCELLAELRAEVTETIPRAEAVFLTPVVAIPDQPEPTPWDRDYWLRRTPDHERA